VLLFKVNESVLCVVGRVPRDEDLGVREGSSQEDFLSLTGSGGELRVAGKICYVDSTWQAADLGFDLWVTGGFKGREGQDCLHISE
jgi:hypothetical protein